MIKNKINIITILIAAGVLLSPAFSFAEGLDPYSFNPRSELRPQEYLPSLLPPLLRRDSTKTLNDLHSAPNPVVVTDEAGNVSVYQGGELKLTIDTKGNKTFYLKGLPHYERDDRDYLTRTYTYDGARATVKNEWGEVVGYKEFGLGGLLLKEFDEKGRHTKSYEYNGRIAKSIIDHLTNSRTLFNNKGKMEREVDFQGATIARYKYHDVTGKLEYKIDRYWNKTVYDDMGRPQFTYRVDPAEGHIISTVETYEWTSRNSYSVTDEYGHTNYYDHDRQQYETQKVQTVDGVVTRKVKTYSWQGTKLISSLDIDKDEATYYENGRPVEIRYNPNGKPVGLWNYDEETGILISYTYRYEGTTYYDHGEEGIIVKFDDSFDLTQLANPGYKPALYNAVVALARQYKDTDHSIAPDIEELLREMAQNNG